MQAWKLIIVDATHHVSDKNVKLITLCVVDDAGYAVPAAFCIAREETTLLLSAFFHVLRGALSDTANRSITSLMSDDASACKSAWIPCSFWFATNSVLSVSAVCARCGCGERNMAVSLPPPAVHLARHATVCSLLLGPIWLMDGCLCECAGGVCSCEHA